MEVTGAAYSDDFFQVISKVTHSFLIYEKQIGDTYSNKQCQLHLLTDSSLVPMLREIRSSAEALCALSKHDV